MHLSGSTSPALPCPDDDADEKEEEQKEGWIFILFPSFRNPRNLILVVVPSLKLLLLLL